MAKRKPAPDSGTGAVPGHPDMVEGKAAMRAARHGNGHWVTIHRDDGGYRHVWIRGERHGKASKVEQRASATAHRARMVSSHQAGFRERLAARKAEKARGPARPSLKEQAAAHRAGKGTREQRAFRIGIKAQGKTNALHERQVRLNEGAGYNVKSAEKGRRTAESDRLQVRVEGLQSRLRLVSPMPSSPPPPARPSLKEQAAAHRASKGLSHLDRHDLAAARKEARAKFPKGGAKPAASSAPHPEGKAFADRVHEAAGGVGPAGRFGDSKVYIHEAHRAYEARYGAIPRPEFDKRLIGALQKGHVELSRADLVEAMPKHLVAASNVKHLGAEFNFVRVSVRRDRGLLR